MVSGSGGREPDNAKWQLPAADVVGCSDPAHRVLHRFAYGDADDPTLPNWSHDHGPAVLRATRRDERVSTGPQSERSIGRIWHRETLAYYADCKALELIEYGYESKDGLPSHLHTNGWQPHAVFEMRNLRAIHDQLVSRSKMTISDYNEGLAQYAERNQVKEPITVVGRIKRGIAMQKQRSNAADWRELAEKLRDVSGRD